MRIFGKLATLALAGAAIVVACGSPADPGEGGLGTQRAAVCNNDCDPPGDDDDDTSCIPQCAGKACGAPDGCGGKCRQGTCPAGTTCGGGGVANQCGCAAQCAGKACGAPDGCGGVCAGYCPLGSACGASGVPNQCGPLAIGQGVECYVFDDGYNNVAGPSQAIHFSDSGQACIPDGTSTGTCRKWFGRCRTTDVSHSSVFFSVYNDGGADKSGPSDAVFVPGANTACVPGNGGAGICRRWFGQATTFDGSPVECRVFDDGGANKVKYASESVYRHSSTSSCVPDVSGKNPYGLCRRWFGECMVAGCGDGSCSNGETRASCSQDCKCGDGVCSVGESCGTCPSDCGSCCGNGTCNAGECNTCPGDCSASACCGDGVCNAGETCNSCSQDCGACALKETFELTGSVSPEGGFAIYSGTFRNLLPSGARWQTIRNPNAFFVGFAKPNQTLNCGDERTFTRVGAGASVAPNDLGYSEALPITLVACSGAPVGQMKVPLSITFTVP
jgi:hypothetical protein